jgi:hypothetical protein
MTVYDIIQEVATGAACSYKPGRWLVEHHDREGAANSRAELFQRHCHVAGVNYSVVAIDEESPDRCQPA